MSYMFYLGGTALPVTPSSMKIKVKNRNRTLALADGNEINLLSSPGLSQFEFEALLPGKKYPFAYYSTSFTSPDYYITMIEKLKAGKRPFRFVCTRTSPSGKLLWDTNLQVTLEEYTVKEDSVEGGDVIVEMKLKSWYEYRENPGKVRDYPQYYNVQPGDTLWSIARIYLCDGNRWREILELNKDIIEGTNVSPGQTLLMPEL